MMQFRRSRYFQYSTACRQFPYKRVRVVEVLFRDVGQGQASQQRRVGQGSMPSFPLPPLHNIVSQLCPLQLTAGIDEGALDVLRDLALAEQGA